MSLMCLKASSSRMSPVGVGFLTRTYNYTLYKQERNYSLRVRMIINEREGGGGEEGECEGERKSERGRRV